MNPNSLAEIAAMAEYLREEYPGLDDVTFSDTLEGETNIGKIVGALIRAKSEADEHAEACKNLSEQYHDMAKANNLWADRARADLVKVLRIAGLKGFRHAFGTVSVMDGKDSLVINTDALPASYFREVTTKTPDKDLIRAALAAEKAVPGASLVRGEPYANIRRAK